MREIEIKARVADKSKLIDALQKLNVTLGEPLKQHDVVYYKPDEKPANWLRIRTENDSKVYFTLKRSVTGELDSIEHEVTVDSESELEAIIRNLGYELFSDLTKTRQKAKYGELEICLDEVPQLGTFVEVEKLTDEDIDYQPVEDELWEFFDQLGIKREDQETSGYDILMRKAQGIQA